MNDCIFCKIVKGEIPADKVYEDEAVLAFLDISPVNLGHTLIIPKEHFENIFVVPEETIAHMMKIAKKTSHAFEELHADGVNITMNNKEAAGQMVFHAHIHVIPRFKGDGFELWHGKSNYKEGEKSSIAQKLSTSISENTI